MKKAKKDFVIALCYDFDGTISPGNMQEYGFIPTLQHSPKKFWEDSLKLAHKSNADEILAYMRLMCEEARKKDVKIQRKDFKKFGETIKFFPGIAPAKKGQVDWFSDIEAHAKKLGATVKHYIISSGLKEMIEGTVIADKFDRIYASNFMYDVYDIAVWPAMAVNYTTKMQFLFRINKGILDIKDSINDFMPEDDRPVPFRRMIYFGDGTTDIPAMKLVKTQGGYSIGVYDPANKSKQKETQKLLQDQRVNYVAAADYSKASALAMQVKRVIAKICAERAVELETDLH